MAYVLGEAGTNAVLVLNLDSGDRIRLTRETSYAPAWSPDGQYLFFWSVGSLYKRQLLDAALLRFGEPTLVADQAYGWGYVVESDGRSVLTALPSGENLRATEIRIDLSWDLQLRQPR